MNSQTKLVDISQLKTAKEYQAELKKGRIRFKQKVIIFPLIDLDLLKERALRTKQNYVI